MSLPDASPLALPVISVLYGNADDMDRCLARLRCLMGDVVLAGGPFPFDMTDYYSREMGNGLLRNWFCFSPADPSLLPFWKERCIEIEAEFGGEGHRRVNIDPGYLDHGKLVLASCKAAPDKIYLGRGVYAHTCLRYRSGEFHGPDHSFADFIDGRFNSFFLEAKSIYKGILKSR